jgi:hypothetical protein
MRILGLVRTCVAFGVDIHGQLIHTFCANEPRNFQVFWEGMFLRVSCVAAINSQPDYKDKFKEALREVSWEDEYLHH